MLGQEAGWHPASIYSTTHSLVQHSRAFTHMCAHTLVRKRCMHTALAHTHTHIHTHTHTHTRGRARARIYAPLNYKCKCRSSSDRKKKSPTVAKPAVINLFHQHSWTEKNLIKYVSVCFTSQTKMQAREGVCVGGGGGEGVCVCV